MVNPLIAGLGPSEILIILVVVVLLFGAKKLPELARGSGQALRIFKAETKGLLEDDDKDTKDPTLTQAQRDLAAKQAELKLAQDKVLDEQKATERPIDPTA